MTVYSCCSFSRGEGVFIKGVTTVHVKSWPTGYNYQKFLLIWGLSLRGRCPNFFMRCK